MEKNKIPVKEIKKLFINESHKVQQTIKHLSQKARNSIYWLKKKDIGSQLNLLLKQLDNMLLNQLALLFFLHLYAGQLWI